MVSTGKLIKIKRKQKDLSAEQLGKELEVSQQYVTAIENDKKNPSENFLKKIYKIFNFTSEEIQQIEEYEKFRRLPKEFQNRLIELEKTNKKLPAESNARLVTDIDFIEVPVRAKASAGDGYINLDECLYTMQIRKNGYHKDCYLIEVVGTSMSPLIEDGCYVIVDPHRTEYVKDKIYVVNYNDETFIKKVEYIGDSGILALKSVNPAFETRYIPKSEAKFVKILGRAVGYFCDGKL